MARKSGIKASKTGGFPREEVMSAGYLGMHAAQRSSCIHRAFAPGAR